MGKDIKEIINQYQYSRDIKRFSIGHNNVFYRTITSKEQVEDYQSRAFGAYKVVKKNYPLHEDDIDYFKDAITEYEICISKCISMNDNFLTSDEWRTTGEELYSFITKLFELYELYDQLRQKKLFQD